MVLYFVRYWHPASGSSRTAWRPDLVWSVREQKSEKTKIAQRKGRPQKKPKKQGGVGRLFLRGLAFFWPIL
jgi:hypothetical protein